MWRRMRRMMIGVIVAHATIASADPAADQSRGEELARQGRFTEAIEAFKAADTADVRAEHACLIALAYTRRELWPQAEVWLATCHERAKPDDAMPEWAGDLEKQIHDRLATVKAAAVTISVAPAGVEAKLTVSSFLPDETFGPRTIHLPPGHHVIVARAPGYVDAEQSIDIADTADRHVSITLSPIQAAPARSEPRSRPWRSSTMLLYTGGALVGAGLITYGWMAFEYHGITSGTELQFYDRIGDYHAAKWTTLGLWAVGSGCLVAGYIVRRGETATTISAGPIPSGAMVSVGWRQ